MVCPAYLIFKVALRTNFVLYRCLFHDYMYVIDYGCKVRKNPAKHLCLKKRQYYAILINEIIIFAKTTKDMDEIINLLIDWSAYRSTRHAAAWILHQYCYKARTSDLC